MNCKYTYVDIHGGGVSTYIGVVIRKLPHPWGLPESEVATKQHTEYTYHLFQNICSRYADWSSCRSINNWSGGLS